MARANRFWASMCAFVLLGVLEWTTLSSETIRVVNGPNGQPLLDVSIRGAALALLAFLVLRCLIHYRRESLEEHSRSGQE
jgi:hypothetical protein